jgi:hypothetical protein
MIAIAGAMDFLTDGFYQYFAMGKITGNFLTVRGLLDAMTFQVICFP